MADAEQPNPQPAVNRWQNKRLGKFRLLSLLGKGAMGKVFLAEDTTLKRQVALKVFSVRDDAPNAKTQAQQFIREARAAAKLNHPHIVTVLEISEQKDMLYIAMDVVEGGDVKRLIETGGAIDPAKACDLAADAADALAFGHGMGVVHRDVKPSNLMLTRAGRCKLADFGLADLGDPNDDFRLPDGVIGTPRYMSPEVARGQHATAASDQYSLAATLWHMLTGQPIFDGKNYREVLEKQAHQYPPPLAELCPGLPESLIDAINQALEKDPAQRHTDLAAFARILRGHSIALGPAGGSGHFDGSTINPALAAVLPQPTKRSRTPWLIGAAAAVVLVLGGAAALYFFNNGNASPDPAADGPAPERIDEIPVEVAPPSGDSHPAYESTPPPPDNPDPIFPSAAPPTSVGSFTSDQTDEIKALVKDDAVVTVTGKVSEADLSNSGKTFMVKFVGNGRGDFQVVWKPRVFEEMGQALGGENGEGVAGKTIRVTGELSSMFGAPQINVTSPDQVEIVE